MTAEPELYEYDDRTGKLTITRNSGFFALCTITLNALSNFCPNQRRVNVAWDPQYSWTWSDGNQSGTNLFELYFEPNSDLDVKSLVKFSPVSQYDIYEDLNFKQLTPYVRSYFVPSARVRGKQEEFLRKYGIEYENTIGLCYRATDKWWEIAQIQPDYYVQEAKRLVAKNETLRVLVQTDQRQVRDFCVRELGERAFFLAEMPVTRSTVGVHRLSESERGISNFELGVRILAAVNILANCKYLITHTGSVGLWTCLYRGTARNTCQLKPGAPDVFSRFDGEVGIKRALFKRLRRLIINN